MKRRRRGEEVEERKISQFKMIKGHWHIKPFITCGIIKPLSSEVLRGNGNTLFSSNQLTHMEQSYATANLISALSHVDRRAATQQVRSSNLSITAGCCTGVIKHPAVILGVVFKLKNVFHQDLQLIK